MNPEPPINFFELFDVPVAFAIDAGRVDRAYRDLQTQVHPDRHAASGKAEQLLAARWAMLANEAYHTLKDRRPRLSPAATPGHRCARSRKCADACGIPDRADGLA